MIETIEQSPLYGIANPKSVVFFGASNNFTSMGSLLMAAFLGMDFDGPVYPVHPKEDTVQNVKAYKSVLDLPETPDLAVIVLPTHIVCDVMEMCGQKGIKHAAVVSGGFREVGKAGVELEKRLKGIAQKYGIRILGPNCLGVTNPHHNLNPMPLPYTGKPGFIGMASQSGSFVTQMFSYLFERGLGFSTAFSVGNETNTDIVDCLEYLGACPHTKVIALYIEGIRRGRAFIEAARAIVPHKPIVAIYIGGSEAGMRAGKSHTGAMAGPDELYDGVFKQCGVIRAQNIAELFDYCWILGTMPDPGGRRVVIQTDSGGPGATGADACGRAGLELPDLSPETVEKLKKYVPRTGSLNNPVDLTFHKDPGAFYSEIPTALIEEPNADMLMVYFLLPVEFVKVFLMHTGIADDDAQNKAEELVENLCEKIVGVFKAHNKPVIGYTWRGINEPSVEKLISMGLPVFPGPMRAAKALAALAAYSEIKKNP